jgi:UDP-N-acetylmuramoyl-L-alanyl-D-glutamate--2,6-diaminopimelate ligase
MAKTCAQLFDGLPCTILGDGQVEVGGIAYNSREVSPGDAFFCIVGQVVDGHTFAQSAIDAGASVIVAERRLYLADATDVTVVIVPDTREAMAACACAFYDDPSEAFSLVGVTGTNGKTTTTFLVEALGLGLGEVCGVIGTTGIKCAGKMSPADHTTPESPDLQAILAGMCDASVQLCAMEVSSHALDLRRVWGTRFAVTVFTNLTQDHLDYHHTFEDYFEAKAKLFSDDYPAARVICIDDKWGRELASRCAAGLNRVITTGFAEGADIHPVSVNYFATHTSATFDVAGREITFDYPLVGKFNVSNIMSALGVALALDMDIDAAVRALSASAAVPGRLERVDAAPELGIGVFVDYAHTPDALVKALDAVRALTDGRVICVFGCGGDRDHTKRPIMGRAALAADLAIVTSDNPRTEDPDAIIQDIVAGMHEAVKGAQYSKGDACVCDGEVFEVIVDRASAIKRAVEVANAGDVILIAGKGHEDYQILGKTKIHFDDREQARDALLARAAMQ